MTTFYVATLATYVLVEAEGRSQAIDLAREKMNNPQANIRTVRGATADEIELQRWHDEFVADQVHAPKFSNR